MARRSKASFEKRAREKRKAEKAAEKREARMQRGDDGATAPVATAEDLAGYGLAPEESETGGDEEPDPTRSGG